MTGRREILWWPYQNFVDDERDAPRGKALGSLPRSDFLIRSPSPGDVMGQSDWVKATGQSHGSLEGFQKELLSSPEQKEAWNEMLCLVAP